MFGLRGQEIILIVVVLLVLFGAKKLPEIGKGVGKAWRELNKALKGEEDPESNKHIDESGVNKPKG